jgi:hypothetical protein
LQQSAGGLAAIYRERNMEVGLVAMVQQIGQMPKFMTTGFANGGRKNVYYGCELAWIDSRLSVIATGTAMFSATIGVSALYRYFAPGSASIFGNPWHAGAYARNEQGVNLGVLLFPAKHWEVNASIDQAKPIANSNQTPGRISNMRIIYSAKQRLNYGITYSARWKSPLQSPFATIETDSGTMLRQLGFEFRQTAPMPEIWRPTFSWLFRLELKQRNDSSKINTVFVAQVQRKSPHWQQLLRISVFDCPVGNAPIYLIAPQALGFSTLTRFAGTGLDVLTTIQYRKGIWKCQAMVDWNQSTFKNTAITNFTFGISGSFSWH